MATIIRIKRRRQDDPLETVLISCKKLKSEVDEVKLEPNEAVKGFLKFAGTVSTKSDVISRPIRDAIRKDKLEKDYKRHQTNIIEKSRQQRKSASKQERFKITASHRTINLEDLDQSETSALKSDNSNSVKSKTESSAKLSTAEVHNETSDKNSDSVDVCCKCGKKLTSSGIVENGNSKEILCQNCKDLRDSESAGQNREKVFQLYDVELDRRQNFPDYDSLLKESQNTSAITCNSVQLEKEVIPKPTRESEENYVYDLYYTNNRDFNLRLLESNLCIEAYTDVIYGDDVDDEEEDIHDDDDDSNDESNWRNDYPDEDPRFFENEGLDYEFGDNLDEHEAFGNYGDRELAEYMSSRCNIEDGDELSSDDEEDHTYFGETLDPLYGGHHRLGYEDYYRMVKKEMDDGDVEDDENS